VLSVSAGERTVVTVVVRFNAPFLVVTNVLCVAALCIVLYCGTVVGNTEIALTACVRFTVAHRRRPIRQIRIVSITRLMVLL